MIPFSFMTMETLLPFLLVLAVAYGGMESANIFKNKAIKAVVAVVIAFFGVSSYSMVQFINSILPYIAVIFLLVFIVGFAKKSLSGSEKDNTMIIVMMVLFLLLVGSFANAGGGLGLVQYTEFLWLIGVVIVLAIIFAAYKMK